jgi:predicted lipoprotein with Yx(FWY)xxD motif
MRKSMMLALAAGLALSAFQSRGAVATIFYGPFQVEMTPKGEVFADAKGKTLYTYDEDLPGVSNCNADCALHWPPAIANAGAKATGELGLIKREDGSMQWTDKGMPLYSFSNDKNSGDIMGAGGEWHVAKPE